MIGGSAEEIRRGMEGKQNERHQSWIYRTGRQRAGAAGAGGARPGGAGGGRVRRL